MSGESELALGAAVGHVHSEDRPHDAPGALELRARIAVDAAIIVLIVLAAVLNGARIGGAAAPIAMMLAAFTAPGAATLTRLRPLDWPTHAALTLGLSLAFDVVAALVLVWSRAWEPAAAAATIGAICAALLALDLKTALSQTPGQRS